MELALLAAITARRTPGFTACKPSEGGSRCPRPSTPRPCRKLPRVGLMLMPLGAARLRAKLADLVLLQLLVERRAIDAEDASGRRLVAADGAEHAGDVAFFDLGQVDEFFRILAGDQDVGDLVGADALGQVVDGDALVLGERDGALDGIAQFAHVAGPGVG